MKKIILISIGGFIGAILRYLIKEFSITNLPINIIIINILGSLILVFFLTLTNEFKKISHNLQLGISIGLIGALTTFSTFCKDTMIFFNRSSYLYGVLYIMLSIFGGIIFAFFGYRLAQLIIHKKSKQKGIQKE